MFLGPGPRPAVSRDFNHFGQAWLLPCWNQDKEEYVMLMSTKEILGFTIQATDGEIGQVSDFLVDDHFKLRYLVIDTGKWLPGKKVALATAWISSVDPRRQLVVMNIDKKRIEEGPDYSEEHVLDREYETRLHAHYQYPPYWV
jgi:PRC-barrel domain